MKKSGKDSWEVFTDYCEQHLGIPKKTLDLISVYLELDLTSKGFSVSDIAKELEIEEKDVITDLTQYTSYPGLQKRLDKNPILWYNRGVSKEEFVSEFKELEEKEALDLFDFLEKFLLIKKEVDSFG